MHYFFSENLFDCNFILEGEEAAHGHVLRLKPNEKIAIVNGKGIKYIAEVGTVEKKLITGKIMDILSIPEPDLKLSIALSPTKNIDRYEWFIEKATELGVLSFIPLIGFQSERRQLNVNRMQKIILSAMKQSGRAYLPTISEPITLKNYLATNISGPKCIAHITGNPLVEYAKTIPVNSTLTVLIGPEGDFTKDELFLAKDKGCIPVSLGDYRLRTETAGLKIAAILG